MSFWLIYYKSVVLPSELYRQKNLTASKEIFFDATDLPGVGLLIGTTYPYWKSVVFPQQFGIIMDGAPKVKPFFDNPKNF